jgi:hypothetical protein
MDDQIVQHRLAAAPVVAVTPVIDQRLDLGERGALGPVIDCLRVRPAGLVDAAVEVLEVRLRDGEGEGVMASFIRRILCSISIKYYHRSLVALTLSSPLKLAVEKEDKRRHIRPSPAMMKSVRKLAPHQSGPIPIGYVRHCPILPAR